MLMIKNMVLAEAVITLTAGTIAKLQVRPFRVCASADSAFVAIAPFRLLLPLLADGGLELDGLVGVPVPGVGPLAVDLIHNLAPEEDQEV